MITAKTEQLNQRLREVEDKQPERDEVLRRLRYLEIQAQVVARRELDFNHGDK